MVRSEAAGSSEPKEFGSGGPRPPARLGRESSEVVRKWRGGEDAAGERRRSAEGRWTERDGEGWKTEMKGEEGQRMEKKGGAEILERERERG